MTLLYSILHMLVDGICALAMFGTFLSRKDGYFYILLYNSCAFALQMPFGAALDVMAAKNGNSRLDLPLLTAAAGVLCTIVGAVTHPVILGIGNALFHIGGGAGTIHEDRMRNRHGRGLGVFVAPGAFGLYVGTLAAQRGYANGCLIAFSVLMAPICAGMARMQKGIQYSVEAGHCESHLHNSVLDGIWPAVCCLLVVVLRSYIGMTVTFPWKTTVPAAALSVLAVVCGKMAGGFAAARYGLWKTVIISLLLAASCFLFSDRLPAGIAALFLFNMTMPVTLYLMICRFPQMPGFSFGFLAFALFPGFLPEYFGMQPMASGNIVGCVGSVLSLLILAACVKRGGQSGCLPD